jgi:hypothetical protein
MRSFRRCEAPGQRHKYLEELPAGAAIVLENALHGEASPLCHRPRFAPPNSGGSAATAVPHSTIEAGVEPVRAIKDDAVRCDDELDDLARRIW